ncbi:MAG: ATP synthase F1 subunit delta [Phycisphaerae bacterium]
MMPPQDSAHAVGDVYAHALLDVANERGQTEEIAGQFADLAAYMDRDREFAGFLTALTLDDRLRRASLDRLFRGKMNDLLLNTLQVLNDRGRPDLVQIVYERFRLRLQEQRGEIEVTVRTAVPLSDELRETIRKFLGEQLGREVILIHHVDPALLGGLIVHVGDRRLDASLAQRLRKLHGQLLNRASAEVRGGRKYFDAADAQG